MTSTNVLAKHRVCGFSGLAKLWRSPAANVGINLPVAAAWLYLSDDQDYSIIPQYWKGIQFSIVDFLFIGPAGIQSDGLFGLYDSPKTGPLATRFEWVLRTARAQNPKIKIIVSQWWGDGTDVWGSALDTLKSSPAIKNYANSVRSFIADWSHVAGGPDGWDVDYEANNVVPSVPDLLAQIRTELDDLSKKSGGREFYVTAAPAQIEYLDKARSSLSFLSLQTYAGGAVQPEDFLDLGYSSKQLLYGICPESGCGGSSLKEVEAEYNNYKLAGIHLWRLNSDNWQDELAMQAKVYAFLHPHYSRVDETNARQGGATYWSCLGI